MNIITDNPKRLAILLLIYRVYLCDAFLVHFWSERSACLPRYIPPLFTVVLLSFAIILPGIAWAVGQIVDFETLREFCRFSHELSTFNDMHQLKCAVENPNFEIFTKFIEPILVVEPLSILLFLLVRISSLLFVV